MNLTIKAIPAAPGNQPPGAGLRRHPLGSVPHWMAGYLPGTDSMFQQGSTGYATNYGIGSDGRGNYRVSEYVPAGFVAWGNGNDYLNRVAVSIEHENDRRYGPESKPTEETHELSALFHAKLAIEYSWRIGGKIQLVYRELSDYPRIGPHFYGRTVPGFGVDFNMTGHRTVAKKTCPGTLDCAWIANEANKHIKGGVDAVELPHIRKGTADMIVIRSTSSHGFIPAGWTFVQGADGVLRALDAKETGALLYNYPDLRVAPWAGKDVHDIAIANGMYEFTGAIDSGDPGSLTGRIIRGEQEFRQYPQVELVDQGPK